MASGSFNTQEYSQEFQAKLKHYEEEEKRAMSENEDDSYKVELYVYDMSKGLARQMSPALLGKQIEGIWHTGVVAYGREYFFGSGGIESCRPGGTILGEPDRVEDLGCSQVPYQLFLEYIFGLGESSYKPGAYDLLKHNCNNFSEEVSEFLCGRGIPKNILALPDEVLNTDLGEILAPLAKTLQLKDTRSIPFGGAENNINSYVPREIRRQLEDPELEELNSAIEEVRKNTQKLENRRNSLNEKLLKKEKKERKKEKREKKKKKNRSSVDLGEDRESRRRRKREESVQLDAEPDTEELSEEALTRRRFSEPIDVPVTEAHPSRLPRSPTRHHPHLPPPVPKKTSQHSPSQRLELPSSQSQTPSPVPSIEITSTSPGMDEDADVPISDVSPPPEHTPIVPRQEPEEEELPPEVPREPPILFKEEVDVSSRGSFGDAWSSPLSRSLSSLSLSSSSGEEEFSSSTSSSSSFYSSSSSSYSCEPHSTPPSSHCSLHDSSIAAFSNNSPGTSIHIPVHNIASDRETFDILFENDKYSGSIKLLQKDSLKEAGKCNRGSCEGNYYANISNVEFTVQNMSSDLNCIRSDFEVNANSLSNSNQNKTRNNNHNNDDKDNNDSTEMQKTIFSNALPALQASQTSPTFSKENSSLEYVNKFIYSNKQKESTKIDTFKSVTSKEKQDSNESLERILICGERGIETFNKIRNDVNFSDLNGNISSTTISDTLNRNSKCATSDKIDSPSRNINLKSDYSADIIPISYDKIIFNPKVESKFKMPKEFRPSELPIKKSYTPFVTSVVPSDTDAKKEDNSKQLESFVIQHEAKNVESSEKFLKCKFTENQRKVSKTVSNISIKTDKQSIIRSPTTPTDKYLLRPNYRSSSEPQNESVVNRKSMATENRLSSELKYTSISDSEKEAVMKKSPTTSFLDSKTQSVLSKSSTTSYNKSSFGPQYKISSDPEKDPVVKIQSTPLAGRSTNKPAHAASFSGSGMEAVIKKPPTTPTNKPSSESKYSSYSDSEKDSVVKKPHLTVTDKSSFEPKRKCSADLEKELIMKKESAGLASRFSSEPKYSSFSDFEKESVATKLPEAITDRSSFDLKHTSFSDSEKDPIFKISSSIGTGISSSPEIKHRSSSDPPKAHSPSDDSIHSERYVSFRSSHRPKSTYLLERLKLQEESYCEGQEASYKINDWKISDADHNQDLTDKTKIIPLPWYSSPSTSCKASYKIPSPISPRATKTFSQKSYESDSDSFYTPDSNIKQFNFPSVISKDKTDLNCENESIDSDTFHTPISSCPSHSFENASSTCFDKVRCIPADVSADNFEKSNSDIIRNLHATNSFLDCVKESSSFSGVSTPKNLPPPFPDDNKGKTSSITSKSSCPINPTSPFSSNSAKSCSGSATVSQTVIEDDKSRSVGFRLPPPYEEVVSNLVEKSSSSSTRCNSVNSPDIDTSLSRSATQSSVDSSMSFGSSYYTLYIVDPFMRPKTPDDTLWSPESSPPPEDLSRSASTCSVDSLRTITPDPEYFEENTRAFRAMRGLSVASSNESLVTCCSQPPSFGSASTLEDRNTNSSNENSRQISSPFNSNIEDSERPTNSQPSPVFRSEPCTPIRESKYFPKRTSSLDSIHSILRRYPDIKSPFGSISTFALGSSSRSPSPQTRNDELSYRPSSTDTPILFDSLHSSQESLILFRPLPRYTVNSLSPEPEPAILCFLGPARPYEPPLTFNILEETIADFDGFVHYVADMLSGAEQKHMEELRAYVVEDEGSWALGEDFNTLFARIFHDPAIPMEAQRHLIRIMAAAALKDDVILMLHQDRKEHTIMNYANKIESHPPEIQEALALFFCNMFEHLSPSEWLLYISEWQEGSQQISNIRVTTKIAVNALLHSNPKVQEYGTALMYNLGTKEVKTVVFDDVAPELAMAILQYFGNNPPEEYVWRVITALCRFCYASSEVPALIKMIGPDPNTFKGMSERIDNVLEEINGKLSRVRAF